MPRSKKIILVLGAGIAGIRVVQRLQRRLPDTHEIVLVDKSPVHVFSPDLYQVATVFSRKIEASCLARIKETVATPVARLVDPWKVSFIQSEVTDIDPQSCTVSLSSGSPIHYDTMVVALGSVTNFFEVPGVETYAYPLKTVNDALAINCQIDHLFLERYQSGSKTPLVLTIAGGGATGVEVAGELMGTLHKLCKKYQFDPKRVSLQVIQSGDELAGFKGKGTALVREQLSRIGVTLCLGHKVTELKKNHVKVLRQSDGQSVDLPCDLLIWTCGVKVAPVVARCLGSAERHGAVVVGPTLQTVAHSNIFALGDCASVRTAPHAQNYVPPMAQYAMKEGDVVAKNILNRLQQKPLKNFHMGTPLYVVPVGFGFALFQVGDRLFRNFLTPFLKDFISLKYSLSILPLRHAWKKFRLGEEIWEQNDEG